MLPYVLWRPLYLSGVDLYQYLRLSTRIERRFYRWCVRADERLRRVALSGVRLALFRA
jgi:hypothetical protein